MEKRIVVLGSTGSIGRASLEVIDSLGRSDPGESYKLVGLAACQSWKELAEQARRFGVRHVAIADTKHASALRDAINSAEGRANTTEVLEGAAGLTELIDRTDCNLVISAIVGAAGLPATLRAVERGMTVAIANKESLVVAGSLLMPLAATRGAALLPVDSEHSAIFQALQSGRRQDVRRIYLTGSGGPFRTSTREQMERASVEDALRHPTWSMGPKITIDSATMMNKALEIIEAHHLFGLRPEQIQVLIHPESVVHSMVEYVDGSIIAQLGTPDMKTPIQYALTHPARCNGITRPLDWRDLRTLNFEQPDLDRFGAITLGYEAATRGGTCGAALNAANEEAVRRFREGEFSFGDITRAAADVLARHRFIQTPALEQLLETDAWARQEVRSWN